MQVSTIGPKQAKPRVRKAPSPKDVKQPETMADSIAVEIAKQAISVGSSTPEGGVPMGARGTAMIQATVTKNTLDSIRERERGTVHDFADRAADSALKSSLTQVEVIDGFLSKYLHEKNDTLKALCTDYLNEFEECLLVRYEVPQNIRDLKASKRPKEVSKALDSVKALKHNQNVYLQAALNRHKQGEISAYLEVLRGKGGFYDKLKAFRSMLPPRNVQPTTADALAKKAEKESTARVELAFSKFRLLVSNTERQQVLLLIADFLKAHTDDDAKAAGSAIARSLSKLAPAETKQAA